MKFHAPLGTVVASCGMPIVSNHFVVRGSRKITRTQLGLSPLIHTGWRTWSIEKRGAESEGVQHDLEDEVVVVEEEQSLFKAQSVNQGVILMG